MNFESFKGNIQEEKPKRSPYELGEPEPRKRSSYEMGGPRTPAEEKAEQHKVLDAVFSSVKDWWSGGAKQESAADAKQESKEDREAREIADERGGIFNSVVDRVGKWREENAEKIIKGNKEWNKKAPQWEKDLDEVFKKAPILRAYNMAWDGVTGVDASGTKKISTKESIAKVVASNVLWGKDVLNLVMMIRGGGKIPPNVFDGATMEVVKKIEEAAREEDPKGNKAVLAGAVKDFLKRNEPTVKGLEAELDRTIEEVAAKA